jgi:hypothetical protein
MNILIITDDNKKTKTMASGIAEALKSYNVSVKPVSTFKGNDILPADAFFLGCEESKPDSFAYIEDLFMHINLAGRPCGIFSPGSDKAAAYLAALIHDSEAAIYPKPLLDANETDTKNWSSSVIAKSS